MMNQFPICWILSSKVTVLQSGQTNSVSAINKEGLSDFGLKFVLKESVSSPNTLCTTPDSYATLVMVSSDRMGIPETRETRVPETQVLGTDYRFTLYEWV